MEYTEKRITSRLPKRLHSWLKDRAKKTNRSMNGELIELLEEKRHEIEGVPRDIQAS